MPLVVNSDAVGATVLAFVRMRARNMPAVDFVAVFVPIAQERCYPAVVWLSLFGHRFTMASQTGEVRNRMSPRDLCAAGHDTQM